MEINSQNEVVLSSPDAYFRESVVWENGKMYLHSGDYHKYITDDLLASMSDDKRAEVIIAMDLLQAAHPRPQLPISTIYSSFE